MNNFLRKPLDKTTNLDYIITMKENMKPTVKRTELDPNNPDHWVSYNEWKKIVAKGAPRPSGSSAFYNDWAANNPTPQAMAMANATLNLADSTGLLNPRGILGSAARPVEL